MVKVAMTGDLVRARYVRLGGSPLGLQVGVDQPCCNECPPCCECSTTALPESCGPLQSIVVEFVFEQLGNCFSEAETLTLTITAEDDDNGFPFSKTETFPADNGDVSINAALFCDGVSFCYVLTGNVVGTGCNACEFGGVPFFDIRLNGTDNENGDCCPSGREILWTPCDGVSATISVTLVY